MPVQLFLRNVFEADPEVISEEGSQLIRLQSRVLVLVVGQEDRFESFVDDGLEIEGRLLHGYVRLYFKTSSKRASLKDSPLISLRGLVTDSTKAEVL